MPICHSRILSVMGGVDLIDQMKVTYEVDRRSKLYFYLRVFFDFLDIAVVYNKIELAPSLPSLIEEVKRSII